MINPKDNELEWTGERYVPQIRGSIALEHLHRYAYACEYVKGRVVLDIASGEGYGSEMLSRTAEHVYGVDIDHLSIAHSIRKYNSEKLTFREGSCIEIPLEDASVDVVVSFETIEHIIDHDKMMLEIKRIMRPGGILIMSSPERHEYSEVHKQQNPFHLKELNHDEFISLLKKHFNHTSCMGQRVIHGSALVEIGKSSGVTKTYQFDQLPNKVDATCGLPRPIYLIGICSDVPITIAAGGLCEQNINESDAIRNFQQALADKDALIAEKDREIRELKDSITGKKSIIYQSENKREENQTYLNFILSRLRWRLTAVHKTVKKKINSVVKTYNHYRLATWIIWTHRKTGIFDPKWYLQNNPDVKESGLNPWWHFAMYGVYENRKPNESFSAGEYILINDDLSESEYNTTLHYIIHGWEVWKEIKNNQFDKNFYKELYPDVVAAGMDPLKHYIRYGKKEGRLNRRVSINKQNADLSISIIIPTHNRANKIERLVNALANCGKGLNYEIIIVNDGSTDQTKDVLRDLGRKYKELQVISINNQGAGVARNYGAQAAKNEILLFIGDDILPANDNFIIAHIAYHQEKTQKNIAILGKVEWPPEDRFEITPVMRHIQGNGGEQFGYTDMKPFFYWDWRFFYTCNISIKREVISDWIKEGFSSEFTGCGFEDGEFALRMGKKYGEFPILYIEESLGHHYHRHNVESFVRRQRHVGAMGYKICKLHPQILEEVGFSEVNQKLSSKELNNPKIIPQYLDRADALFKIALDLEKQNLLGCEAWHKELLHGIFKTSANLGFIDNAATPVSNYSEALKYVIDSAEAKIECRPQFKEIIGGV